jgi:RNA polymerase sigma-70 factor (ECF subfamily)
MIYCVIPRDLAPELHEQLRTFYGGDSCVDVVVDVRNGQRRSGRERRIANIARRGRERRRQKRRREADRRAAPATAQPVRLPPLARPHARRIRFVRLEDLASKTLEEVESARLATLAGGGDGVAFEALYLRYYDRVYSQLRLALSDQHEAEDVAQEVFARLLRSLSSYDPAGAPFTAWLHVITRNAGFTRLKRLERVATVLDNSERILALQEHELHESCVTDPADLFDRDALYIAERLPHEQRRVLALRFVMELTHDEIGAIVGKSPDAVRKMTARAREHLAARVRAEQRGPQHDRRVTMVNPAKAAPRGRASPPGAAEWS